MLKEKDIVKINRKKQSVGVWTTFKRCFLFAIFMIGFLGLSQIAVAQKYPTRPITLLINVQPGAATDMGGRLIVQGATKILGQEIIVVNKTGGGGSVGAASLVNSTADGYTLLGSTSDQLILSPQLEPVGYDLKGFTPIIQYGIAHVCIVVRSDSPYKSFKDLIDFARKNPGKVSYGPPQFGTIPHLAMEHVMMEEKVNIAIIPFMGSAPAITALLGGHISACGVTTSAFISHFKAGKVKVLATLSEKRIEAVPDAPTFSELGYPLGGVFTTIYLIAAPKGTSSDVVKTLEGAFRKAMETPEFIIYAKGNYVYVENPLSGQDLKEYLEVRYPKIGDVIRNIKGK